MRTLLVALVALSLVTGVQAAANLKIFSEAKARVMIDGEDYGPVDPLSPMVVSDLKAGKYKVKLENLETGEEQVFSITAPKAGTVQRQIRAFQVAIERRTVIERQVVQAPPSPPVLIAPPPPAQIAPPVVGAPVVGDEFDPAAEEAARKAAAKKSKDSLRTKTRNVVLGGALVNEVFNKGKSKGTFRKAAVAIGLINEAANR